MQIRKILSLGGPNVWANYPVLEAWVDLGHFDTQPSNTLPGFVDRLTASLPSMMDEGAKGRKLLPARTPAAALQAGIAKIEGMKAKTWRKDRAAALNDLREALGSLEGSV